MFDTKVGKLSINSAGTKLTMKHADTDFGYAMLKDKADRAKYLQTKYVVPARKLDVQKFHDRQSGVQLNVGGFTGGVGLLVPVEFGGKDSFQWFVRAPIGNKGSVAAHSHALVATNDKRKAAEFDRLLTRLQAWAYQQGPYVPGADPVYGDTWWPVALDDTPAADGTRGYTWWSRDSKRWELGRWTPCKLHDMFPADSCKFCRTGVYR